MMYCAFLGYANDGLQSDVNIKQPDKKTRNNIKVINEMYNIFRTCGVLVRSPRVVAPDEFVHGLELLLQSLDRARRC